MRLLAGVLGVLCATPATLATADDLRPLYMEINEDAGHRYLLRIKTPPRVLADNIPQIVLPQTCGTRKSGPAHMLINCADALYGAELSIRYPRREVANSTVVRVNFVTGESHTMALSSGVRTFRMPGPEDVATVAAQYAWLGAEHIWIGFDHLLFLVCLIWISGTWNLETDRDHNHGFYAGAFGHACPIRAQHRPVVRAPYRGCDRPQRAFPGERSDQARGRART